MINYSDNVKEFYKWFSENRGILENTIDNNEMNTANNMLKKPLSKVLDSVTFQLYKNYENNKYILELNTILDSCKKIIYYYFCEKLDVDSWEFHYYHHAFNGSLNINNSNINGDSIKIIPVENKIRRNFDIKIVNNSIFEGIDESERFMIIYMLLIENLGEIIVESYLGSIEFLDRISALKYSKKVKISISEFGNYIDKKCKLLAWTIPESIVFVAEKYTRKSKCFEFREDITEGSSYCLDLLNEENQKITPYTDYIKNCGIGIFTIFTSYAPVKDKKEIDEERKKIEMRLTKLINEKQLGMVINSAKGNAHCYTDYFVYDYNTQNKIEETFKGDTNIKIVELCRGNE